MSDARERALALIRHAIQSAMIGTEGQRMALESFDALADELREAEAERDQARAVLRRSPIQMESALARAEAELREAKARLEQLEQAVRGMLELDSYRPRDGSVNPVWEAGFIADARAALSGRGGEQGEADA